MRRSIYGETIQFRVPDGISSAFEQAASRERTTVSEWLRRVTIQKLREAGIEPNDSGGTAVAA